jgi:O-antigen/teichoic acid export membrane protein
MSGFRQRVLAGMGANASGQVVTVAIQLLSVPLFLHYWSVEDYGQWLLLSALPGYLSIADLGIGTVAMNRMVMLHAQDRLRESQVVFQTALLMVSIMTVVFFLSSCLLVWLLPLDMFGQPGSRSTMTLLILVALLNLYSGLFDAVHRASSQFARGTYLSNLARLLEWLGGIGGLLLFRSMVAVAAGFLAARLLSMVALQWMAARRFPAYPWGMALASRREFRDMVRPALSFLAFPLGNALTLQGMSILVGTTLGPVALALFNTYRTLSRLPIQMLTTLNRSLWPEISRCFGNGDYQTMQRIYTRGTMLSLLACAAACILTFIGAPWVLDTWTSRQIPLEPIMLALFLIVSFTSCTWQVGILVLMATNKHERIAGIYLLAAISSVAVAVMMPARCGVEGIVVAMGVFEIIMLLASRRLVAGLVGQL